MESLGEKIKELRKGRGISQEELSYQIEVSRQTINKWEANAMQPGTESIAALCRYFEVKPDYFFGESQAAEEAAAAAENDGGEVQEKVKDKRFIICLSLLIVFSVLFVVFVALSIGSGFNTFSSNVGIDVVSNFKNAQITFAIYLSGSIISLGAGVILIFLLKKFKK